MFSLRKFIKLLFTILAIITFLFNEIQKKIHISYKRITTLNFFTRTKGCENHNGVLQPTKIKHYTFRLAPKFDSYITSNESDVFGFFGGSRWRALLSIPCLSINLIGGNTVLGGSCLKQSVGKLHAFWSGKWNKNRFVFKKYGARVALLFLKKSGSRNVSPLVNCLVAPALLVLFYPFFPC